MASQLTPNWVPQNFYTGYLSSDITASATDIFLDTTPTNSEGVIVIDPDSSANREIVYYNARTATKVTASATGRGYDGTTATSHTSGTKVIIAPVADFFGALQTGQASTDPLRTESFYDFVASGCVWTGDSYGGSRAASMTSGVVYINGRRYTVAAVTSRVFTASKDTYIDLLYSTTTFVATPVYTEVNNNAASPALAANSVRIGIIVTGASNIAAVGSVNQGEESKVLPIASSVPYAVTDSLGNLICPRDPSRKVLGYRQLGSGLFSTASSTAVQIPGLSMPIIIPPNRKIKLTLHLRDVTNSVGITTPIGSIWDGTVGSGTRIQDSDGATLAATNYFCGVNVLGFVTNTASSSASKTYNAGLRSSASNNISANFASDAPGFITAELA